MMIAASIALALACLYAGLTAINLTIFRTPPACTPSIEPVAVSLLIPARDESARIEATLAAVLASRDVDLEVLVLDDNSSDDTAARVARIADTDGRVRLISGAPLPPGWNGKQHACAQLAAAASRETFVFIDADVTLAPDALARIANYVSAHGLGLASGFPRQHTPTTGEMLLVPMIAVLLLGYLPLPAARWLPRVPALATGCGQLMAVTRQAYRAAGGHAAFADRMHDGLHLSANVRRAGHATDVFNAASLASCRMYTNLATSWQGFAKDATEGMARPIALPVWTVLLAGGHLLSIITLLLALASGHIPAALLAGLGTAAVIVARAGVAWASVQPRRAVYLHPAAVVVVLALQWRARIAAWRGQPRHWRGRTYEE